MVEVHWVALGIIGACQLPYSIPIGYQNYSNVKTLQYSIIGSSTLWSSCFIKCSTNKTRRRVTSLGIPLETHYLHQMER